jgi:hypothetical protein
MKGEECREQEVLERTNPPTFLALFNELNVYKGMTLHKITEFYTVFKRLSEHNLKISHHRHI